MSSFRRDLFQRRLWPVIVLLLLAIVAVPLFLRRNANADVAALTPAPQVSATAARTGRPAAAGHVQPVGARSSRNPFAGATSKPASPATAGGTSSRATSTTPGATGSSSSAASSAGLPATASTTSATTTAAAASTTPAATSTTPSETPAPSQPWTIYAVDVRFGTGRHAALRSDVARLAPLPSVARPKVMFMGVMVGGRQAVFALGAGLGRAGPGLCRPDHTRCSAIVLKAGQTEEITVPSAGAGHRQLFLQLVRITNRVTHSRRAALAAYERHSAAGRCELDLTEPESYSRTRGTLSRVAATECRNHPAAVPFPNAVPAP